MVSSTNSAYNLTVHNTASPSYSLHAMTVVVIIFLPLVLAYQAWTYWVFRKRVSASDFQPNTLNGARPPHTDGEASAAPAKPNRPAGPAGHGKQ